ncbi:MAG TPA: alkaline phosphatase family protein [Bryobacteraceae bacterium]|nr:alkaline phosphatase family protein [Bryobacteraceae bacterium]
MKRFLAALLLWACACAATPPKPKLILAIVIDQFWFDYLNRFRADFHGGFAELLDHGAVFTDAHHIHFPTVTAVGHSTFLSGATPSISGIAGNEWYDRATSQTVTSVSDSSVDQIGGAAGIKGSSPRRMLVSTVGDEIKMQGQKATIIGISIKDRGAILPAGHMADGAYWFDPDTNHWVTSSYYMKDLPAWVKDINASKPALKYLGQKWYSLDAPNGKPLCTMVNGEDGIPYCGSLEATPWGNELIEAFAERAVVTEDMGHHPGTDILAVSFSSNDYVGHAWGPDSEQVRDVTLRTDRLLGQFLNFVEQRVGRGNLLVVLTADHGVVPVPEVNEERKMPGGRLSLAQVQNAIRDALTKKYGAGKWIQSLSYTTPYFNQELIRSKQLDEGQVEATAADAVRALPHIFRVYTGSDIASGRMQADRISQAVTNGYYRGRTGDLIVLADPYYLFEATGTSHGTPFNYDNHVPVIFMGPGIKSGEYPERIAVNDIAPTLSAITRVEAPSGSVGRILSEMFQ